MTVKFTGLTEAKFDREPSKEELEQWAEMERLIENCPKKEDHSNVDPEDGCLECGFGAK